MPERFRQRRDTIANNIADASGARGTPQHSAALRIAIKSFHMFASEEVNAIHDEQEDPAPETHAAPTPPSANSDFFNNDAYERMAHHQVP